MFFKKYFGRLGIIIGYIFLFIGVGEVFGVEENRDFYMTDAVRSEARYVIQSLEKTHYNKKPITQLDTRKFLDKYIDDLDANHLFLLQSQVNEFHHHFDKSLTTFLKQGNIYPAYEIFKVFRADAKARIAWVIERLNKPFNFSDHSTYVPVRKDLPFPSSKMEADELWEKRLKYELLNELLSEPVDKKDKKEEGKKEEKKELEKKSEKSVEEVKLVDGDKGVEVKEKVEEKRVIPSDEEVLKAAVSNVQKRYEKLKESIDEIDETEVKEIFLTSLAEMYDSHSSYLSADTLEDFSMMLSNSLVGIGATLALEDGYCTIKELITGGPAERSKELKPNDKIVGVAQGDKEFVDVIGMKLKKTVRLIRGEIGTIVRLLIQPADGLPTDRKIVSLTRDEIRLTSNLSEAKLFEIKEGDKTFKIGVIEIPSFYASNDTASKEPSVTKDVEELIHKLEKKGMQGLILDLRYNGGGLLPEAITLTGLFIPIGPVVHVKNSDGQIREYIDTNPNVTWKGPLAILTSKFSASASEIFAGALKNYKRALIVGDSSTHGKGSVQLLSEISKPITLSLWSKGAPKMGATKFTVQKWYLPDGSSTQLKGVPSDIIIPSINEFLPIAESDLPNPLAWDTIQTIPWTDENITKYTNSVDDVKLHRVRVLSEKRQNSLEEFSYLKDLIEHYKKKKDQKEYSLNLPERKKERLIDKEYTQSMEKWLDKLSEFKFEGQEIKLDSAMHKTEEDLLAKSIPVGDETETSKNTLGKFDIYRREGLRIMANYIELEEVEKDSQLAQVSLVQ